MPVLAIENMSPQGYEPLVDRDYQQALDPVQDAELLELFQDIQQINENAKASGWMTKTPKENREMRQKMGEIVDKLVESGLYPAGGINEIFPRLVPDPDSTKCWDFTSDLPIRWSSPSVPATIWDSAGIPSTAARMTTSIGLAAAEYVATAPVNTPSIGGSIPSNQALRARSHSHGSHPRQSHSIDNLIISNHERRPKSHGLGYNPFSNFGCPMLENRSTPTTWNSSPATRLSMDSIPSLTFGPSKQLLDQPRQTDPEIIRRAQQAGVSIGDTKYRGDLDSYALENAQTPQHLNCAVFIKGIPPHVTDRVILSTVTEGKVFSYFKKEQCPQYPTCAATITFMTRETAVRYMNKCQQPNGMVIGGQRVQVVWSKHPARQIKEEEMHQSRVLRVKGLASFLDTASIEDLLHQHIDFVLAHRREWMSSPIEKTLELTFCSIRGQSRLAMKCLGEWIQKQSLHFTVQYGPDPCNVV